MATLEDIVAASKILTENPDLRIGDSGSNPEENKDGASAVSEQSMEIDTIAVDDEKDKLGTESLSPVPYCSKVRNSGGVSADDAIVSEQNMEIETTIESTLDNENEKIRNLSPLPYCADAVVCETKLEIGRLVESKYDCVKEKLSMKNLSFVPCASLSVGVIDGNDSKEHLVSEVDAGDSKEELVSGENNEFLEVGVDTHDSKEDVVSGENNEVLEIGVTADDSTTELVSGENHGFLEDSMTENVEGNTTNCMDVDGIGNEEELMDEENDFQVGDFVWAKIRSHPWWPGQVYDSKDASEFAMKRKQEGRLLVAFFGDGTCSWCLPSQLIPFVENFSKMSRESDSRSFLNAVESALDEVGRLVESELTCMCISKDKRDFLTRPVVDNAGLKAGVIGPSNIDTARLSFPRYEPTVAYDKLIELAKGVSIDSALEVAVIRSQLSAFYYYNGGYQLSGYHDPVYIEGLEDKNTNENESDNDFSVPIEVPILGPQDDDWPSSPAGGPTEDEGSHMRKQKSVAELMGENKNIKSRIRKRGSIKEGVVDSEKPLSSLKKKNKIAGGDSSAGKKGKKRKVEEILESPKPTDGVNPKGIEIDVGENDADEGKEEVEILTSPRERKKSKYLSPPYTNAAWRIGIGSPRPKAQVEHDETVKITQTEECQNEAMEDTSDSQPISKSVENAKLSNGKLERLKVAQVKRQPDAVKNDKELSFSVSDVDAPVNELLSDIELASRDPFYLSKKGSLEKVRAFASALRSSINLHGQNYEIYEQSSVLRNGSKKTKSKSEGSASPCLVLQFSAGIPLPSKKDVVKHFDKFGSLNTKKTKVEKDSHSIHVAYVNESDAEAAYKSSLNQSPFACESVDYKSSPATEKRSLKRAREPSLHTDGFASDFKAIRQKLEITEAIVANYLGKFSSEDKASLKDEMKHVAEVVETVSEKVRVMCEKTSV